MLTSSPIYFYFLVKARIVWHHTQDSNVQFHDQKMDSNILESICQRTI